jgi:3-phytase/alkaline phosphatase D
MLGQAQYNELAGDLLDAQARGITWKFIMVPEPIQNLGPLVAADRFEGYAYERSRLLQFIDEQGITNVAFITADIHSTFINNVTYQLDPNDNQRTTGAFEISTGSVAYAAPLGPTVLQYVPFGGLSRLFYALYGRWTPERQDRFFLRNANRLLRWFGYSPVGLQRTSIDADMTEGSYLAVNWYGWSEFEIDALSQRLTVTTYGIPWYDQLDLADDPDEVLGRAQSH